jgi:drug/metabolite transporter (DMT)-like permease
MTKLESSLHKIVVPVSSSPKSDTSDSTIPYYLLLISTTYVLAAANEYWLVNWFKQIGIKLPLYFAILQNSSWSIQLIVYLRELRTLPETRLITYEMYRSYVILGCLAAFINLTRMFSLATLPPVITVICSNTEIVFETTMSIFILKKEVSRMQYSAVGLVLLGVLIALWDPTSQTFGGGLSSGSSSSASSGILLLAVGLSISSRFASSLNTILAEQ